ncbi:MAG: ABC transporter substrate-binding protein, partial [Actinobacteria bacterium]|nr:ABC transporter substrate-binding protein [Actinomycetota bacterium]
RHQQVVTEALYLHLWYGGTWGDGDVPDDVGGGGKWAPGVADRWDIVEPGRVVRFHINPKVKWHDGKPVTADDVIYGFHIASHPDWGQKRGASDYRAVKGMIEWTKNPTNDVQDAGGLTKIDNMTVQVTLERPDPTWWSRPLRDNSSNFPPLPKHLWEKVPPKDAFTAGPYVREPVGCGPFKFVRFVQGQFMEMERNPDFVFGAPLIDKYIVRFGAIDAVYAAAEKGEVDHVRHSNVAFWERLKGLPHIKSNIIPLPETYAMSVNRVDPAFKNVKMPVFIQGMARSIDRNKINETIMKSTVTISDNYFSHVPIVASPPAGIVPKITYDLEAAKKLIKDSGYDTNSVLKWPYTGTVAPEYQAIISYLAEAGIKIEIVPGDGPTVEKMVREQKLHGIGNTHLGFYNNLISAWQRFKCGFDFAAGGLNVDSICDPELDGLFEKASLATTVEALTPLWLDVSRRLHGLDTMLFAPLWRYSLLPSYHRRVQGPQWRHNDSRAVRPPLEKIWIDPNWDKK